MSNRGAEMLRAWIDERGVTLSDAQFDLRVSKQLLSIYLSGDSKPGREKAITLREKAGIPVDAWDEPAEATVAPESDVETGGAA